MTALDNPLLHSSIADMLLDMEAIFQQFGIDYYIVGAVARDIQLSHDNGNAALRKTEDVDLAIMLNDQEQFYALKAALVASGNFTEHPTEAIKMIYKQAIEVDLLPFGEIEKQDRKVVLDKPRPFVLDMPGFKEVHPYLQVMEINDQLKSKVCNLEGIILLKLISHNDRPERDKDITDIEHIINAYFDINDEDIYSVHWDLMEKYDTSQRDYLQVVCSHVIGRKMNKLLKGSVELTLRIKSILDKRPTNWWKAMLAGMNDV